jgi:hypothetical protein
MSPHINRLLFFIFISLFILSACQQEADKSQPLSSAGVDTEVQENTALDDIPQGQLGTDVIPKSYQLTLTIVPELDEFSGKAIIELEISEPKDHFYLHGKKLEVSKTQIITANGTLDASYEQVDKTGISRISLPQPVSGSVRLEIEYSAPLRLRLISR